MFGIAEPDSGAKLPELNNVVYIQIYNIRIVLYVVI